MLKEYGCKVTQPTVLAAGTEQHEQHKNTPPEVFRYKFRYALAAPMYPQKLRDCVQPKGRRVPAG